jgi:hypothetical protein
MNKVTKIVAAGLSTVALAGGIGAGIAYADQEPTPSGRPTGSPTVNPTGSPTDNADRNRRGLLRRTLHGEATLRGEKHQVVAFQRGKVETVSGRSLTVKSEDGFIATYVLNAATRVRKERQVATLSDIKTADRVWVVAIKNDSTLTARVVRDHGA